jgi:hypothetical protein
VIRFRDISALVAAAVIAFAMTACAQQSSSNTAAEGSSQPITAAPPAAPAPTGTAAAFSGGTLAGVVLAAGAPIANSTVTLWAATSDAPKQVAQTRTDGAGKFALSFANGRGILYLVATGGDPAAGQKAAGDNSAIVLLSVLGSQRPVHVVVNEMTTVAAAFTMNQFLKGTAIAGYPLGLRIASGNVPNFVNVGTGGWGTAIQDTLNGAQTPTMANFATLADVLSGCVTRVQSDACSALYAATESPTHVVPTNTLTAIESVAHYPWYQPERLFTLLAQFYPVLPSTHMRGVPYMPYLSWSPSAWVVPLAFDGGGYKAGGKAMFDSEGNLWVGDNFTVGWQGQDTLWQGNATKFAPNGQPLSPITTGFTGGGMEGGTFGAAVDSHDNAWFTNYGSKSISVFDKNGKPLTPPHGISFGGRLGLVQGIIATPSGDIWALGLEKNQLIYFPKGDLAKGRIVCEGDTQEPCKSFKAPFHLGIDQQNRIWVANSGSPHVTRFPVSDPTKAENFKTGINNSGLAIDSGGNVWITNRFGTGPIGMLHFVQMGLHLKFKGVVAASDYLTTVMSTQKGGPNGGSVTLLRPDGSPYPGSPFKSGGLPGPWAAAVDGDDNVWISNFASANSPIVELCGTRTENCPPGMKTGDQISPPDGYTGGGMQMLTDILIDPAGNVWTMSNWQNIESCIGTPPEAISTRCGGENVTVFYGMAKPVRAPQIGPAVPY